MDTDPQIPAAPPLTLEPNECWNLLRANEVGRLGVVVEGHPEIFPVNYVVDHGSVVFRTAAGTKLAAALTSSGVAFEVDGTDGTDVWSVVIRGRAHEVTRLEESLDAAGLAIHPSQSTPKNHVVRITPEVVSGRRFARAAAAVWESEWTTARHAAPE